MSENNETEAAPAGTAKQNIIRAAILVVLLAGLGFAVVRMMAQQKHNREVMDVNRSNPNVPAGGLGGPKGTGEIMKNIIKTKMEIKKEEQEAAAKKAEGAAPAAPAAPAATPAP